MDMGATLDTQYRVNKTQFGDGYTQRSSTGINNTIKNWSGTKTGDLETVIKPIEAFLDDHAGVRPNNTLVLEHPPHSEKATFGKSHSILSNL